MISTVRYLNPEGTQLKVDEATTMNWPSGTHWDDKVQDWIDAGNTIEPYNEWYGLDQQQIKAIVKAHLDAYYWPKYEAHENPFYAGYSVGDSGGSYQAKQDRRAYNQGDPAQDPIIDQILASAEQYHTDMKAAYDAIWQDLKQGNVHWEDIPTDSRWPVTPAFVNTAAPDEPIPPTR
jgi:hypothetical protein